ncbi:MAG TPA: class I SAM-dependent methyltransferase [Verrucomicrobiae bacterium]|nr:class I SAM-dependent methyltransferase [Verrucomicrobiae bacterium]
MAEHTHENLDQIAASMKGADDRSLSAQYYLLRYGIRMLQPRLAGPEILELGCGEGGMTRWLGENFPRVTTVDGSPALIEQARLAVTTGNVDWRCCTFEEFEPKRRFDSILMSRILEHIEHPVPLLRRVAGWLAPGARLYIIVPNAHSLNRRIGQAMGMIQRLDELTERDRRVGHFRVYHKATLDADLRAAGLVPVKWDGIFLKPLSDAQVQDWPEGLLDAFWKVGRDLPEWCTEIYVESQAALARGNDA